MIDYISKNDSSCLRTTSTHSPQTIAIWGVQRLSSGSAGAKGSTQWQCYMYEHEVPFSDPGKEDNSPFKSPGSVLMLNPCHLRKGFFTNGSCPRRRCLSCQKVVLNRVPQNSVVVDGVSYEAKKGRISLYENELSCAEEAAKARATAFSVVRLPGFRETTGHSYDKFQCHYFLNQLYAVTK